MAVTASGLYLATWIDILDATQLAVDLSLTTNKIALFNNTITPNFAGNGDTAYGVAPYATNEVTGTNWAAGGVTLGAPTIQDNDGTTANVGVLRYDANDVSVASATFTGARCGLIYADALAGNNAILLVNFGADYSPNNGTFSIQWASSGIFSLDLTP